MAFQPKTEPGSPPGFPSTSHRNYKGMSISELVSVLRTAYQIDDFDKVEDELVSRDAKLKAEIGPLLEKIELERQMRVKAEEELKKKEEQCERGKRAQEDYERLLKEVKKNGLVDKSTIDELRSKNLELEHEKSELKKKWVVDGNDMAELRTRICVLEDEKAADKNASDSLRMKKGELEEAVKENLATIEELRTENRELANEKRRHVTLIESLERKFGELNERVVKLEDDARLLMSVDDNIYTEVEPPADPVVTSIIKDEEEDCLYKLDDIGDPAHLQRNEGTRRPPSPSKGNKDAHAASAGERLKSNVIEILDSDDDDDDDNGCTSQGLLGEKAISQVIAKNEHQSSSHAVQPRSIFTKAQRTETVKRKISFSEISSNSSFSSDFNLDNLLSCTKKSKT